MALTRTGIEYLTHCWNFQTGCRNWQNGVCPVGEKCWARAMAHRFGRSFEPQLHPEKLLDPLRLKKPARIGVCFTGDLFGDWVDLYEPEKFHCLPLNEAVLKVINDCPQHQFFFLTKCPWNLRLWEPFPDNAWVGVTVCNQKMLKDAFMEFRDLRGHKWLSIEPLMESLDEKHYLPLLMETIGIDWVVIGGWSDGKPQPRIEWVREIVEAADKAGARVFLKNNLMPLLRGVVGANAPYWSHIEADIPSLRQELPYPNISYEPGRKGGK